MDEQLQQKIDEARAAGYTDEEINQYVQTMNQTVPEQKPMERTEQNAGLAEGIGGKALEYGAEAYAGKKLIVDPLMSAIKTRITPPAAGATLAPAIPQTQQATGTYGQPNLTLQQGGSAGQQAFNQMGQQLTKPPLPAPSMMQQGMNYAKQMQQIAASKVMPALNAASKAIIPAQMAMGVGYTSPEEIATLKAAEARKRAQGWKPLNER